MNTTTVLHTTICSQLAQATFSAPNGQKVKRMVCSETLESCSGIDKHTCQVPAIHTIKTIYINN